MPLIRWMDGLNDRQWTAFSVLVVLCFALIFQGSRPLLDPDEGRYTAVALQMLSSGDFLHPALGPEHPHMTKPAFTYWIIAASMAIFGQNEWAARLPYALAFALTASLVMAIAGALGLRNARWGAGLYALMFWPFISANVVTTDVFLTLFEALGALGYIQLWRSTELRQASRARLVMALGFGLAFFTKGPPGLLPLAAFALHAFWCNRWSGMRSLFDLRSSLVFCVVAFGWYAALMLHNPALLEYLLENEVVDRLAGEHKRNPQFYRAFVIYGPTLIIGSLPWAGFWLRDAWRMMRARAAGDEVRRFILLWFGLPLIVFVLAKSRLVMYVLPLFVPLAVWTLLVVERTTLNRWWRLLPIWMVFLLGFKAFAAYQDRPEYAEPLVAELRAAVADEDYDRIVTFGTKSHYGFRLYTGKIVEHFFLGGDANQQKICQRFTNVPARRVVLVRVGHELPARSSLASCGWELTDRGAVGEKMRVMLLTQAASDPKPTAP